MTTLGTFRSPLSHLWYALPSIRRDPHQLNIPPMSMHDDGITNSRHSSYSFDGGDMPMEDDVTKHFIFTVLFHISPDKCADKFSWTASSWLAKLIWSTRIHKTIAFILVFSIYLNSKLSHCCWFHRPGLKNIGKGAPGCAEDDIRQVIVLWLLGCFKRCKIPPSNHSFEIDSFEPRKRTTEDGEVWFGTLKQPYVQLSF